MMSKIEDQLTLELVLLLCSAPKKDVEAMADGGRD